MPDLLLFSFRCYFGWTVKNTLGITNVIINTTYINIFNATFFALQCSPFRSFYVIWLSSILWSRQGTKITCTVHTLCCELYLICRMCVLYAISHPNNDWLLLLVLILILFWSYAYDTYINICSAKKKTLYFTIVSSGTNA